MSDKKLPSVAPEYDLEQLFDLGLHFGHQVRRWNPKMAPYIYTAKNGVHIFDLVQTAEKLKEAYNKLYYLGKNKKQVIFLGTKRQAKETVKKLAETYKVMYIASRWLGGMLTNWEQVKKSLKKMLKIEEDLKENKYKDYTKYEQVQIEKEKGKLERFFGGIRQLNGLPDAIFVIDPKREDNAVEEAAKRQVPVVALADSNADPDKLELLIPGNDDAQAAIAFVLEEMMKAYSEGRKAGK